LVPIKSPASTYKITVLAIDIIYEAAWHDDRHGESDITHTHDETHMTRHGESEC